MNWAVKPAVVKRRTESVPEWRHICNFVNDITQPISSHMQNRSQPVDTKYVKCSRLAEIKQNTSPQDNTSQKRTQTLQQCDTYLRMDTSNLKKVMATIISSCEKGPVSATNNKNANVKPVNSCQLTSIYKGVHAQSQR